MNTIGIVFDRIRWEEKILIKKAKNEGLELKLVDSKKIFINMEDKLYQFKQNFSSVILQRCISYFRGLHITSILENVGIQVINPFQISLIAGNKLFTTQTLIKAGIPTPKTLVAFTENGAIDALHNLGYPAVIKPIVGSWGRMIALIRDKDSAQAIIESREAIGNSLLKIYYLQEYVKRPPRDIRLMVIQDEVIAGSYRYSAEDDWKTNVARGGKSKPCEITSELEEIALKTVEAIGCGILAVDCMESTNGILVHEVNSTVEFRGLSSTTNVDIAGKIITFMKRLLKK